MTSPLELHESLLGTTYPSSLTLSADGHRLAYVAGATVGGTDLVVTGTAAGSEPRTIDVDGVPVIVRWADNGNRLWLVDAPLDGEACRVSLHDLDRGIVLSTATVEGAIEDLVVIDADQVMLRIADPGSDRDGMNLGVRVSGTTSDPRVDGAPLPLRRLVTARRDRTANLHLMRVDLGPLTVWDFDVQAGQLVAVVSADHLPAGYYLPSLVVAEFDEGHLKGVREVHRTKRQLARPRLSPDGRTVAVLEGISIVSGQLVIIDLATGESSHLPHLDDVTDFGWLTADSGHVAGWHDVGVQVGTVTGLLEPQPTSVTWTAAASMPGDGAQPSLAVAASGQAYGVWEAPGFAPEVVSLSLHKPGVVALSRHNHHLHEVGSDVTTERISWLAADGTTIHGLLMTGSTDVPGPRPLVALLHGGPTWLWTSQFAPAESNHLALPLVAAGAAVLLPNPRGSSGRGQDFAAAVFGQMGANDLEDVMAGVTHLVEQRMADADRVGVMGLSYGGYLSALASLRTDMFAAAAVLSGVSDWLSFATTSVIGGGYDQMYQPDGDLSTAAGREARAARSPIYRAQAAATPTLIIHGAEDAVTPLSQAEQLHRRWRSTGTDVELVVYPGEGHELIDPEHRRDAAARVLLWFTHHGVLHSRATT